MTEHNFRPRPTPPPDVAPLMEAYKGSRTEMFEKVLCVVDESYLYAQHRGDERHVRYIEEEIFPFLEAEQEKAAEEEGLTPVLRWEESLFARSN